MEWSTLPGLVGRVVMVNIGVGPLRRGELVQPWRVVRLALAGAGPALGLVVLGRNLGLSSYQGGSLPSRDEGGALLPTSEVPLVGGDVARGSHDASWCLDSGLHHPPCPPDSRSLTKLS